MNFFVLIFLILGWCAGCTADPPQTTTCKACHDPDPALVNEDVKAVAAGMLRAKILQSGVRVAPNH